MVAYGRLDVCHDRSQIYNSSTKSVEELHVASFPRGPCAGPDAAWARTDPSNEPVCLAPSFGQLAPLGSRLPQKALESAIAPSGDTRQASHR